MGPNTTFSETAYLAVAQDSLDFALSAFASPSAGPTELALRLALPRGLSVDRSETSRRQLMVMAFSFVLLVSIVSTSALPSSATTKRL